MYLFDLIGIFGLTFGSLNRILLPSQTNDPKMSLAVLIGGDRCHPIDPGVVPGFDQTTGRIKPSRSYRTYDSY